MQVDIYECFVCNRIWNVKILEGAFIVRNFNSTTKYVNLIWRRKFFCDGADLYDVFSSTVPVKTIFFKHCIFDFQGLNNLYSR